jgi:hypothetical protein
MQNTWSRKTLPSVPAPEPHRALFQCTSLEETTKELNSITSGRPKRSQYPNNRSHPRARCEEHSCETYSRNVDGCFVVRLTRRPHVLLSGDEQSLVLCPILTISRTQVRERTLTQVNVLGLSQRVREAGTYVNCSTPCSRPTLLVPSAPCRATTDPAWYQASSCFRCHAQQHCRVLTECITSTRPFSSGRSFLVVTSMA